MPTPDVQSDVLNDVPAPIFDQNVAMARVGGDKELLKELAQLFVEEYPRLIGELKAALDKGDPLGVEHSAHGLKGSMANFGAKQGVQAALEIEQLGRRGDLNPVSELLHTLDLVLLALHGELDRL